MKRLRFRRWLVISPAVLACFAIAVPGALAVAVGENLSPVDLVQAVAGASSSVGENVTPGDSVSLHPGESRSVAENVTPNDVVSLHAGAILDVAENVTPNDLVALAPGQFLRLTENVTPGDGFDSTIVNTAPKLILPATLRAFEGAPLGGLGAFQDPDPQHFTATVDWGDGSDIEQLVLNQGNTFALDHVYDDNAQNGYTLSVALSDGLVTTTGTIHVDVENVAPTAAFAAASPVDEGAPAALTFAQPHDPSAADTKAGFTYAYDCGRGYGQATPDPASSCTFDDQGTYTVHAKILDKDGGSTEYSADVVVGNVAPTAFFTAPASVAEGSAAALTFSNQSDPSQADTTAGFTYAYDCGQGYGNPTPSATASCTFDDGPGTPTVRASITDKDGGTTEYTATIDVANVAPTATLANGGPADEGSPVQIAFSSQHDPSTADAAAGFTYAFACDGVTLGGLSTSPATTCSFDDGPSTHTVLARIMDKDGGYTDYTTDVTVQNIAPQATLTAPASVPEGSPFTLSLGSVHDPSLADTAAGFTYAFDCGDGTGLSAFGAASSTTCATADNGTRNVQAAVRDKDGGVSTYTATVAVTNVAPTATLVAPRSADEGSTFTVSLTGATDPSSADTAAGFTYAFDCGSGYGAPSSTSSALCAAVDDPGVDVRAKIVDKDGGATEYTAHVAVANRPPVVRITAPAALASYPIGTTVTFAGSFADPGVADTHTAQWTFDALSTAGAVTESGGSGTVAGSFTFTAAGIYTVTLTVTDNAGASASATSTVVVFDTSLPAKVTGGGWVPDGAGQTTLTLQAEYKKGSLGGRLHATLASGHDVEATGLQWLVVAGRKAELAGTATYDGAAGYAFVVTIRGGGGDGFRLELWRTSDGTIVYDNVPGGSDDIDLATTQPLGGGNFTIH